MIDFQIYNSFNELPQSWDTLVGHDIFLQSHYLKALGEASPQNISWYYVGVFDESKLVGVAIIQRAQLYLKDMFRDTNTSMIKTIVKNNLSKVLKGNLLVVGNLTHTGQHGLFFVNDKISQTKFLETLFKVLEQIKDEIKQNEKKNIRVIMFKDYFKDDVIHLEEGLFKSFQLHKVNVQPNMIMFTKSKWLKGEDYITDLNKKYRTRYKRARHKFGDIQKRELDEEAVKTNSEILYKLYKNVSDNARFNTFILPQNHFYSLKRQLKENFRIFGYYLNNELIGFYTLILNNKTLETYFLGYDEEHQYPNQLYLNMLYDMVFFAIENKFTSIVYARTAMEIKSSVGAESKRMIMHMKHTNSFINAILRQIFNFMKPSQKWEERHPFKMT